MEDESLSSGTEAVQSSQDFLSVPKPDGGHEKNFWRSMRDQDIHFVENQMSVDVFNVNHMKSSQVTIAPEELNFITR